MTTILSGTLTANQLLFMQDMQTGVSVSWTFAPGTVRRMLRAMIDTHQVCKRVNRTFEGDPQVYEFVVLTERGKSMMGEPK